MNNSVVAVIEGIPFEVKAVALAVFFIMSIGVIWLGLNPDKNPFKE